MEKLKKIWSQYGGEKCVLLVGAGVSYSQPSNFPTGSAFMSTVLKKCAVDDSTKILLDDLCDNKRSDGNWLRFEGLLEVLARFVDKELGVLKMYAGNQKGDNQFDGGIPNDNHGFLASLIRAGHYVVTTNFDVLIEKAMNPSNKGFVTEDQWEKFTAGANPGSLLKIHGSLLRFENGGWVWNDGEHPAAPVVTLRRVSRTRQSIVRRNKFGELLGDFPLLVVGYSASDDFDVSRWLLEIKSNQPVLWIQHTQTSKPDHCQYLSGADVALGMAGVSPGLLEIAQHWQRDNGSTYGRKLDLLHVFKCSTPEALAAFSATLGQQGSSPNFSKESHKEEPSGSLDSFLKTWAAKHVPNKWSQSLVSGALLAHCFHFPAARELLEKSLEEAKDDYQKTQSLVLLSETESELPLPEDKAVALQHAAQAFDTSPGQREARLARANALLYCSRLLKNLSFLQREELKKEAESIWKAIWDNSKASPFERSRAAAELYRMDRHFGGRNAPEIDKIRQQDLAVEALIIHETARRDKWQQARSVTDIRTAIQDMTAAVDLRERLGELRGLCASTNVLGNMYQRLWEWITWEVGSNPGEAEQEIKRALYWHERSVEIAERYGFRWDRGQAEVALSVLCLRWENDSVKAWSRLLEAECERETNGSADNIKLDLQRAILVTFRRGTVTEGVRVARDLFAHIVNDYGQKEDTRQDRGIGAAQVNMSICDWVLGNSFVLPWPDVFKGSTYWRKRIMKTQAKLDEHREKGMPEPDLHRIFLDPLP
ncbi:MAG: SIR2 family protein [Candidatus Binatia bacterium]